MRITDKALKIKVKYDNQDTENKSIFKFETTKSNPKKFVSYQII